MFAETVQEIWRRYLVMLLVGVVRVDSDGHCLEFVDEGMVTLDALANGAVVSFAEGLGEEATDAGADEGVGEDLKLYPFDSRHGGKEEVARGGGRVMGAEKQLD